MMPPPLPVEAGDQVIYGQQALKRRSQILCDMFQLNRQGPAFILK